MNSLLARMMCVVVGGGLAPAASAQIFYEPVHYQYGSGSQMFYYGGHDPEVIAHAESNLRSNVYTTAVTRSAPQHNTHVYSDACRTYDQADNSYTTYGSYTANDARNEANANVPRYFRKRDLLNAAVVADDGSWVVPAQAQPLVDIKVVKPFGTTMSPAVPKGTILVIPRKWLEKPAKNESPSVAMNVR